jgi:hypothetical protein
MLNRTNLTLSASALSKRLNLGTRSLAARAGVNVDGTTFHICPSHPDADLMREDGMVWYVAFSIPRPKHVIPAVPSSVFPVQPRHRQARPAPAARRAAKRSAVLAPATPGK